MLPANCCERSTYSCDGTVGTITQYDNHVHTGSADGTGSYPLPEQVSGPLVCLKGVGLILFLDCATNVVRQTMCRE